MNKKLDTDKGIFFDIDGTLVDEISREQYSNTESKAIEIYDSDIQTYRFYIPRKRNIQLLKNHYARGFNVLAWSAAGASHAERIATALELDKFIKFYLTKPIKICDDLTPEEWLTNVYLKEL